MFAENTWRRWTLLVVGLALLVPATIFPNQKHKKKKDKESLPAGIPVLWRAPSDIKNRDLYLGEGGKAMQPDLRRVTLIEKEKGGYSTKYRVRDASGREWVVKLGKEAKGETAASRLMWAVGYFPDVNYLVPKVHVEGLNKDLENVRFGLRPKGVKRVDGWQWKKNPFVGSREFQGMKVMMALLNNWDIKDSNNKVAVVRNKKIADNELRYFVSDLGGSFGKVSHIPRFLYFKPDRNNPKAYVKTRLIDKVKDDRVDFHYKLKRKDSFKNITVDQAQWINGWLSRLSDRQIEDAFRAANYSPEEVRMMSRGVRARIGELNGVRNTLAKRTRNH
ncbi:MAG TPA: hypothetical protein VK582_20840 [Pyrinomonadaceae bacterium]|nr:hypothetical protein [Pyrinomonadaceae bacterium]